MKEHYYIPKFKMYFIALIDSGDLTFSSYNSIYNILL